MSERNEIIEIFVNHGYNRTAVEEYVENNELYADDVRALEKVIDGAAVGYDVSDRYDAGWALIDFDMIING